MTSGSSAYSSAGVDYQALDAGKRGALTAALSTSALLERSGGRALDESRGEPAFVFQCGELTLGFVLETLGTKSLIARQLRQQVGPSGFAHVAYDTVAAIVNDLCCVGALPLVVNAYFATGSSSWYSDSEAHSALLAGWREGCVDAGATWGGGESPALAGLVADQELELAGSAVGMIPAGGGPILGQDLAAGDEIVLVKSSGLHANGASLARLVADRLPEGYATALPSGRSFGVALLDRSVIYSGLVRALLENGTPVHYLSHITGHGFLKLMRPKRELGYRIWRLPEVPEVLALLSEHAGLSAHEAYSTLNMGTGFAVYCAPGSGEVVTRLASALGLEAHLAGRVEEGPRQVVLEPVDVVFESEELDLTPHHQAPAA
jgi:phosphoribosylformylglycinamidine cyclo-ligase